MIRAITGPKKPVIKVRQDAQVSNGKAQVRSSESVRGVGPLAGGRLFGGALSTGSIPDGDASISAGAGSAGIPASTALLGSLVKSSGVVSSVVIYDFSIGSNPPLVLHEIGDYRNFEIFAFVSFVGKIKYNQPQKANTTESWH
jgi:hypothetical protein